MHIQSCKANDVEEMSATRHFADELKDEDFLPDFEMKDGEESSCDEDGEESSYDEDSSCREWLLSVTAPSSLQHWKFAHE